MATLTCPTMRVTTVEVVDNQRVGAELEQCENGFAFSCLGGEVDGRDTLAVVKPAKGTALVRVGAELYQRADCIDATIGCRPGKRGASVGVGIDVGAKLDQEPDPVNTARLCRPHERFVDYLLGVVGRLPVGTRRGVGRNRDAPPPPVCRPVARSTPRSPRPAPTRRLSGSRPSNALTSRLPQNSAAINGVPPSPRANRSVRAPAAIINLASSQLLE